MNSRKENRPSTKTLLDRYKLIRGKQFQLRIEMQNSSSEGLTLSGFFSEHGKSLYAHCENPKAIGGSQDTDKELARIKAIMRMLNGIEARLAGLTDSEIEKLKNGVGREELIFAYKLKKICNLNSAASKDDKIPVYEELAKRDGDKFVYSRIFSNSVKDFNEVIISESNSSKNNPSARKISVSIPSDDSYILRPSFA